MGEGELLIVMVRVVIGTSTVLSVEEMLTNTRDANVWISDNIQQLVNYLLTCCGLSNLTRCRHI